MTDTAKAQLEQTEARAEQPTKKTPEQPLRIIEQGGVRYTICTDVSKDGLLQGTARALYGRIRREQPDVHLIASGGVADTEDLDALAALDCYGVIVGKAIYEGRISLEELNRYAA